MGECDSAGAQSCSDNYITLATIFIDSILYSKYQWWVSTLVHCSNSYLLGNCYILCTAVLYHIDNPINSKLHGFILSYFTIVGMRHHRDQGNL